MNTDGVLSEELLRNLQVLGVDVNSSKEKIAKEFKKLALKYHPDKSEFLPEDEKANATEKFVEIHNAYHLLTDEKTQKALKEALEQIKSGSTKKRSREEELATSVYGEEDDIVLKDELELEFKKKKQKTFLQNLIDELELLHEKRMDHIKQLKEESLMKAKLKVSWNPSISDYSQERLLQIFQMFGSVKKVSIKERKPNRNKNSALIEFADINVAKLAHDQILGDPNNRLKIKWGKSKPIAVYAQTPSSFIDSLCSNSFEASIAPHYQGTHEQFENEVLRSMQEKSKSSIQ